MEIAGAPMTNGSVIILIREPSGRTPSNIGWSLSQIFKLKLATSVAKLMDNVTPEDIVTIAGMLAEFIRNNKNGDIDANDVADFGDSNENDDFNDEMPDEFNDDEEDEEDIDEE